MRMSQSIQCTATGERRRAQMSKRRAVRRGDGEKERWRELQVLSISSSLPLANDRANGWVEADAYFTGAASFFLAASPGCSRVGLALRHWSMPGGSGKALAASTSSWSH